MADENREEIEITAKDLTASGVNSAKKNLDDLGKAGETARLGFWGLGEAAENAAQSMGAPNQLSRQLGNSVEGLASKLGGAALAFGLVGFAAMAGVGIYNHFAEAQKKATEETLKAGVAAGNWIEAATKDQAQTDELAKAKGRLRQAEFDLNKQRAEAAIPAMVQQLKDLTKEYNALRDVEAGGKIPLSLLMKSVFSEPGKEADKLKLVIGELAGQLGVARAQAQMFGEANRAAMGMGDGLSEAELIDARNAYAWDAQTQFDKDMIAWKAENDAILRGMDYEEYLTKTQLARDATQVQIDEEMRLQQFKQTAFTSTLSFMTQSFQAMYNAGGSHARRNFSLFKTAAIVETVINADRAAGSAYAWGNMLGGPALGTALAGIAYAAGWARVQSIRKQTFDGGGGGGGGGAPVTYGGSSAVVPPSGTGTGGINLTLNVNGQQTGIYEITKGVVKTLWSNNGSIDGLSVSVEQSA